MCNTINRSNKGNDNKGSVNTQGINEAVRRVSKSNIPNSTNPNRLTNESIRPFNPIDDTDDNDPGVIVLCFIVTMIAFLSIIVVGCNFYQNISFQ